MYITGRRKEILDNAAARLGDGVIAYQGDVSNKEDMERLAELIKQQHGTLDIIFANAGGGKAIPFMDATYEDYRKTFDGGAEDCGFEGEAAGAGGQYFFRW